MEAVVNCEQQDFRLLLQREFVARCEKNRAYSLRAFSKSLQINHGALSQIMSNKRPLSKKMIKRLGSALSLSPKVLERFLKNVTNSTENSQNDKFLQLKIDSFEVLAKWYDNAILELILLKNFRPDAKWIAQTLGLSVIEVNTAIERLLRLKFITIDNEGNWQDVTGGKTTTIDDIQYTNAAKKIHQIDLLKKAQEAVEEVPLELRDNSGVTMAINHRELPEVKKLIKKFRRELDNYLDSNNPDQVYQLCIAFYPLTNIDILEN